MKYLKSLTSASILALLLSSQAYADTDTEVIDEQTNKAELITPVTAELEKQQEKATGPTNSHEDAVTSLIVEDPKDANSVKIKKAKVKSQKGSKQEEIAPLPEENTKGKPIIEHQKI